MPHKIPHRLQKEKYMKLSTEEVLADIRRSRELVETINNINNINDIIDINDTNDMANFDLESKSAKPIPASLAVGGRTSSSEVNLGSGQEAEGVKEIAKPKLLADERTRIQESGLWMRQNSIDYMRISFWKPTPNDPDSFKVKYSFKTIGNNNLAHNNYSILLTRNRFDFRGNVKKKWADYATEGTMYSSIDATMKEYGDNHFYAGKAQATRKFSKGIQKIPMEPFTATCLFYDPEDDAWVIRVRHHDFVCVHAVPRTIWEQKTQQWIRDYAIQVESKKARDVPPFYSGVWRL